MKAIRVTQHGGPEVLKVEEIPKPKADAGEVLIRVQAVGVNPVDTYIRSGGFGTSKLPYTPTVRGWRPGLYQLNRNRGVRRIHCLQG